MTGVQRCALPISISLRENLYSIPANKWPKVMAPDVKVVSRFSEFWEEEKILCAQKMVRERWEAIEKRREELV